MSRHSFQTHVTLRVQLPGQKSPGDGYSLPEPPVPAGPIAGAFPTAESVKQN